MRESNSHHRKLGMFKNMYGGKMLKPVLESISRREPLAPICTWVHILEFGNIRYNRTRSEI
jgi:hypothetical protein